MPAFVLFNWLTFFSCICWWMAAIYIPMHKNLWTTSVVCICCVFNNNIQHVIYVNSMCTVLHGINVPVSVHIFIWHNSWCLHIFWLKCAINDLHEARGSRGNSLFYRHNQSHSCFHQFNTDTHENKKKNHSNELQLVICLSNSEHRFR